MKKISFLVLSIITFCSGAYAQNTSPWSSTGNVGIGTNSPAAPLDFGGNIGVKQLIYGSGGILGFYMGFGVDLGQAPNTLATIIGPPGANGTSGDGSFSVAAATSVWPYTAYQTRFTVLSSGNVGINTVTPMARLSVAGTLLTGGTNANLDPNYVANNISYLANTGQMLIGWNKSALNGEADFINNRGAGGAGGFSFYDYDNANVSTQLLRITGNGNVGIGIATPLEKLAVNGVIHSQEVKVDMTGWSDYVLKKEYPLLPLSEVKSYIDKNQHLPDMPSESEVIKSGLNLGEMNKLLTKKVEELTLYLVDKDKNDRAQQSQINSQQSQIDNLKKQVEALLVISKK
ncbi:hypothetical protein [Pedobacter sp. L105]|uniref:hypothetical protein n=1 Tax=Pedobacter sp. L105 TaxID=1641871 RepID=UPI00131B7903|nr:hypothetical protein [Pedobacter sp. L105]